MPAGGSLSRRSVLQVVAASVGAGGVVSASAAPAHAEPKEATTDWVAFDQEIGSAFDTLGNVGGAVAVVSADAVLHTATFGFRSLQGRQPVTADTHFAVASTTKSMTAAMVAGYVDRGALHWDQPVIDAWSGFRAPTDTLTRTLRVRDLLGMASGIRDPYTTNIHAMTAEQLVGSLVTMPVIGAIGTTFFYSNTVYAMGGYLPLLASGVAPRDLEEAYAETMRTRIFGPACMPDTRLVSDPRDVVDDYATGYIVDTRGRAVALPYGPMGSGAPSGGAQASVTDMAAWVRLQLRQGRSVNGRPVVTSANLTETWRPHIDVPPGGPNVRRTQYAMGWNVSEYQDGTQVLMHTGSWDGFSTLIAFLPQHDLGVVVLNNLEPIPTGRFWMDVVLDALLTRRLGLHIGGGPEALAGGVKAVAELLEIGRQATAVDPKKVQPYLGYYEGNWSLFLEGRSLRLRIGPRVGTLLQLPDGSYFVSASTLQGLRITLGREADGTPHLTFVGYETVRRMTGLA